MEPEGGAPPGLGHVDMRIGAVDLQKIGVAHHLRRHVGVEVETDRDGQALAQQVAQAAQQLALPVLMAFGDHRPVQVQIDAVQVARCPQVLQQHPGDGLKSLVRDMGGGRRRTPAERQDFMPQLLQRLQRSGDRQVDPGHARRKFISPEQTRPALGFQEMTERRLGGRKGVGFVLKAADGDTHGGWCP